MKIKLVKFNKKYEKFLFDFRNKKILRKNSLSNKKISLEKHSLWLKNFIKNVKNLGFIIKLNSKKIGYIRYDATDFFYEISIGILPNYHKKGYASEALNLSEKKLKKKVIISKIINNNKKSELFFIKNKYEYLETKSKYKTYIKFVRKINYKKEFKLINEIQKIRSRNNVNWMNILKIAFSKAPIETKQIFKKVSMDDSLINKKSKKLFS